VLVQGSVYPEKYKIRTVEDGIAYIRLRRNITEKEVEHDGQTDIIYDLVKPKRTSIKSTRQLSQNHTVKDIRLLNAISAAYRTLLCIP